MRYRYCRKNKLLEKILELIDFFFYVNIICLMDLQDDYYDEDEVVGFEYLYFINFIFFFCFCCMLICYCFKDFVYLYVSLSVSCI